MPPALHPEPSVKNLARLLGPVWRPAPSLCYPSKAHSLSPQPSWLEGKAGAAPSTTVATVAGFLPLPPSPISPDPWRQSPRQPQSSGGWVRGIDAHCPFVFLLWFFVSSFLPPCPWGPSCTACLSPSPRFCFSFLLPLFLHCRLFSWAFVFPCWSLCLDLSSLLPYGCSCPSLGTMAPCSPNDPGSCLLQTHRRSCPRLAHLPDGRASCQEREVWESDFGILLGTAG